MSNDLIKSSLEEIQLLNNLEKEKLNYYCNMAFKDVEETKGKSQKAIIDLGIKDGYKRELVERKIRKNNYPTSKDKLKNIGLSESSEEKLIEEINKGKINSTHITNITKANIDNALPQLPTEKQEKVIEKIIKNTNEKDQINKEEIATEAIQDGNISLMIVESWYKGILRSSNQFESKLYINKEVVEFLSKDQLQELYKVMSKTIKKCNEFINELN